MTDEKTCFVIAPIEAADSDVRRRSDQILKFLIRPAVAECGYKAIRADDIPEPGLINSQVIQQVIGASLVIADLTGQNPNVFYELAIRHATRKPLIQLIRKGDPIPFDVAGMRTISVDHTDLDSVHGAKKEIEEQIKAIERNPHGVETPIPRFFVPSFHDGNGSSFASLAQNGAVSAFRIPKDNDARNKRTLELLAEHRAPNMRLAASSGRSYLGEAGAAWINGVGNAVIKQQQSLQVVLASPFGSFGQTRALANTTELHLWQERISLPRLRALTLKYNVKINVTEHPLNCSLFFVGDSVQYDPYLWSRPADHVPTENNFWVFEFKKAMPSDSMDCFELLEGHFNFLLKNSVSLDEFERANSQALGLHQPQ